MLTATAGHVETLDQMIKTYDVLDDKGLRSIFQPVADQLWDRITGYGIGVNDFGSRHLAPHLNRIADDGSQFLAYLGYPETVQQNFAAAYRLSDLGKTHDSYDPNIWSLQNRPTDQERREKSLHTVRGPEVLENALIEAGAFSSLAAHPHIQIVVPALMAFHHERRDGTGPRHLTTDEPVVMLEVAKLVDTYDGDLPRRGHRGGRTPEEVLLRMAGLSDPKYVGAFDQDLLGAFIDYKSASLGIANPLTGMPSVKAAPRVI